MLKIIIGLLLIALVYVACSGSKYGSIERALLVAHHKFIAVERPTVTAPALTLDEAYKIQDRILSSLKKLEVAWVGYKLSPNEIPDESFPGGKAPVFGRVIKTWKKKDGREILLARFVKPFMENEIAFVFKSDVPVNKIRTKEDLIPYIEGFAPAVEFPDIRYKGEISEIMSIDLVADNAVVGNVLVGDVKPLAEIDVDSIKVSMSKDGKVIDNGVATKPARSQWDLVLWLVKELDKRNKPLKKGWFVITGAMGSFMPATPGFYTGDYGVLGKVTYTVK